MVKDNRKQEVRTEGRESEGKYVGAYIHSDVIVCKSSTIACIISAGTVPNDSFLSHS